MCIEKDLSNKKKYPTFARTAVTGYELVFIIDAVLSYYKWKKVSVILHDLFPYKKLFQKLHDLYKGKVVSTHIIEDAAHYNYTKHYSLTLSILKEISSKSKSEFCFSYF